ncbi:MAG: cell division protein FtsL [Fibrobacterota bacterium]
MKIKIKLRTLLTFGCVILSLFLFPIVSVWKKSRVQDMVKSNEELRQRIRRVSNANLVTRLERDRLAARERIEAVARKELGLEYPASRDVRLVLRAEPQKQGENGIEKAFVSR